MAKSTTASKNEKKCPITRDQFRKNSKPVMLTIGGTQQIIAGVKEFESGSLGWYANGKINMEIDGVPVQVQVGCNMTIVNSKELPG